MNETKMNKIQIEPQMVLDGSYCIRKRQDGGPITVWHLWIDSNYIGVYASKREALAEAKKRKKEEHDERE